MEASWVDPTIITLIGGQILTVIAALAAAVVAVINALRTNDLKKLVDADAAKIQTVATDTAVIKGHVNSEKTAAEGRQRLLENENAMLKDMLTDKKATASLLAQAAALRSREAGAKAAPVDATVIGETLKAIETNTEAIDENTKK